ncbi:hypothetical protein Kisp02_06430 [Kineosporia sp. NBRC 101731]|nr:hypothetical protein Kisp02_06430 [Kineosporia sp. NBRC 101731]
MAAAFLTCVLLATGTFAICGFAICAEYLWPRRLEYDWRCRHRNWDWDGYWPIAVPLVPEDVRF